MNTNDADLTGMIRDLSTPMLIAARELHVMATRRKTRAEAEENYRVISEINGILGPRLGYARLDTTYTKATADYETEKGYKYN